MSKTSGARFASDAGLTDSQAFGLGGKALAAYVDAGGPDADIARAELARRAVRKQGATFTQAREIVRATVPVAAVPPVSEPARLALLPTETADADDADPLRETEDQDETERDDGSDVTDPWHVAGAPVGTEAYGRTYDGGIATFETIRRMVNLGEVTADDALTGKVRPAQGPWPRKVTPITSNGSTALAMGTPLRTVAPVAAPAIATGPVVSRPVPDLTFTTKSTGHGAGEVVAPETQARASADRAYLQGILDEYGLATSPTAVREGAVLIEAGQQVLMRSYREHHDQPNTVEALTQIAGRVQDEFRRDIPGGTRVAMLPDGRVQIDGWPDPIALERSVLSDLVSRFPDRLPRAGAVMAVLPPTLRATVWNTQTAQCEADRCVFRTRAHPDGGRQAFAVVSPGYTPVDADEVCDVTAHALRRIPGGELARGPVEYDPESSTLRADAVFHVDRTVNFGAGDVFKIGARVQTNDAGGGALSVRFVYWRNLCLNLGIIESKAIPVVRMVHKGNPSELTAKLAAGIRTVMGYADPFMARWTGLRDRKIVDLLDNPSESPTINVRALLREIAGAPLVEDDVLPVVKRGALPPDVSLDGIARDAAVERMLSAWHHEPGDTLADVVNAVTRIHSERVPVPVLRSAERTASALFTHWT